MCVRAKQSSVGTDQEPRDKQGWQILQENTSCVRTGIWGKEVGHTVLERRRSSFIQAVFLQNLPQATPARGDRCKQ